MHPLAVLTPDKCPTKVNTRNILLDTTRITGPHNIAHDWESACPRSLPHDLALCTAYQMPPIAPPTPDREGIRSHTGKELIRVLAIVSGVSFAGDTNMGWFSHLYSGFNFDTSSSTSIRLVFTMSSCLAILIIR